MSKDEKPGVGHNSGSEVGGIAGDMLTQFIERIEPLESEKSDLATDIREVYSEAKGNGFDPKIMRQIVKLRKMEEPYRVEQDMLIKLYRDAVGIGVFE